MTDTTAVNGYPIGDDEVFYRRVPLQTAQYRPYVVHEACVRISSQAFSDRTMEPSVDRATIRSPSGIAVTQGASANGAVSIAARSVRSITIKHPANTPTERSYIADVHPAPTPENSAHCLIRLNPTAEKQKVFEKLLERLARLARWEILPEDVRHLKGGEPASD